jgi:hypothetical protein
MSTYLQATHFFDAPLVGNVNTVFGIYHDVVRRTRRGRWLIAERSLDILGSVIEGNPIATQPF